jgi:hypothetical protein
MRRHVTIWAWLLVLMLAVFWFSGLAIGYSLGTAQAQGCSGYDGQFIGVTNCDGQQCTRFQLFGFWTYNCTPIAPPPPPPAPLP